MTIFFFKKKCYQKRSTCCPCDNRKRGQEGIPVSSDRRSSGCHTELRSIPAFGLTQQQNPRTPSSSESNIVREIAFLRKTYYPAMISQFFVLSQRGDNIVFRDCKSSSPPDSHLSSTHFLTFIFFFFHEFLFLSPNFAFFMPVYK